MKPIPHQSRLIARSELLCSTHVIHFVNDLIMHIHTSYSVIGILLTDSVCESEPNSPCKISTISLFSPVWSANHFNIFNYESMIIFPVRNHSAVLYY